MDIVLWPLFQNSWADMYVEPINYGGNVFYHDHSMTRIKVVKYFENLHRILNKTTQPMYIYLVSIN